MLFSFRGVYMSDSASRIVWFAFGSILFMLAFNYFSVSQQWGASLGLGFLTVNIGTSSYIGACVVGLPIVGSGSLILCFVGTRYAKARHCEMNWDSRVPVKLNGLLPGRLEAKILAAAVILGFVAFPLYCVWHFFRKLLKYATVCDTGVERGRLIGLWSSPGDFVLYDNRFRVGAGSESCDGITFEPFFQPSLMLIIATACTASSILLCWRIFSPRRCS